MSLSTTKPSRRSRWLWFIGLYCASFIVVGAFMTLTHWIAHLL